MRNALRWMVFAAMVALAGLALAFAMLFLSRLYGGLQNPAFLFIMLVFYSVGVTIGAIQFATKLEEEEQQAFENPPLPPRFSDRENGEA